MVISVPVFSPCRDLQGAEPPDVLARVHAVRKAGFEVQQAVHESLHMKAIDQANRSKPEQSCPSKEEVPKREGEDDQVWLNSSPEQIA